MMGFSKVFQKAQSQGVDAGGNLQQLPSRVILGPCAIKFERDAESVEPKGIKRV